ncbi:monovalent cation/H(+) antiporter subunit G [Pseudoxanthobacter sp.]|uniref:monovalent cation/H(+) antiporter subunit G n=1 Tax=Pseudoxanthobacter sp. TaxID=1925742 RepID=UPI002FE03141
METAIVIATGLMVLVGAVFALMAAIGILRFGDIYMRMHAASKAGTVGSGLALLAVALDAGELGVVTRAIAGAVFLLLTAPVSAHLLARAFYKAGYRPAPETKPDALADAVREGRN